MEASSISFNSLAANLMNFLNPLVNSFLSKDLSVLRLTSSNTLITSYTEGGVIPNLPLKYPIPTKTSENYKSPVPLKSKARNISPEMAFTISLCSGSNNQKSSSEVILCSSSPSVSE